MGWHCFALLSDPGGSQPTGTLHRFRPKITNVKDEGLMRYACDQDLGILFWEFCSMSGGFAELERHTEQQNASQKKIRHDIIEFICALLSFVVSCRVAAFVKLQWDLALAGKMLRYRRGPVSTCPPLGMGDVYQTVSCCLTFG